jgi:hypothetical protein
MKLLSEFSENQRRAEVWFDSGKYLVITDQNQEREYWSEQQAENAAEDYVLNVVDSGTIHAIARK